MDTHALKDHMTDEVDDVIELMTDEWLDAQGYPFIHALAEKWLPEYSVWVEVVKIDISSEVIGWKGTLTAIDEAVSSIKYAYERANKLTRLKTQNRYGNPQAMLLILRPHEELTDALKYELERDRTRRAKAKLEAELVANSEKAAEQELIDAEANME